MRNIKLTLMYDGTAYCGWQSQKNAVSVQDTLQKAMQRVLNEEIKLTGCSRTDAGVHAVNYTANFKSETKISAEKIPLAFNTYLPSDIRVKKAEDVPEDFHSRYNAKKKEYRFYVYTGKSENPFYCGRAMFVKNKLDFDKMKLAAGYFTGRHDFKSFMAQGSSVCDTVREIYESDVRIVKDDGEECIYEFRFCGNGFLYNMVRIMVGTLIEAGEGRKSPQDIPKVISAANRDEAGRTAKPCGLYLFNVEY